MSIRGSAPNVLLWGLCPQNPCGLYAFPYLLLQIPGPAGRLLPTSSLRASMPHSHWDWRFAWRLIDLYSDVSA